MNKELKEQVIIEANNLKKHATKEELNKLDFNYLKPSNIKKCIYGQMTGDCFSNRAAYLVQNCSPSFYDQLFPGEDGENVIGSIGGWAGGWRERNFSAIEVYIGHIRANNKTLIDYLRGDRDSLTTKDL